MLQVWMDLKEKGKAPEQTERDEKEIHVKVTGTGYFFIPDYSSTYI